MYQMPDHLTPHARPRHTPAPKRHQRKPSHGPNDEFVDPALAHGDGQSFAHLFTVGDADSRTPPTTNSARKMSSMPIRDWTCETPSR